MSDLRKYSASASINKKPLNVNDIRALFDSMKTNDAPEEFLLINKHGECFKGNADILLRVLLPHTKLMTTSGRRGG